MAATPAVQPPAQDESDAQALDLQFVFGTACSYNADVSSEALVHSFWKSNEKGQLTRLDACPQKWVYPVAWLSNYRIRTFSREKGEADRESMLANKPWLLLQWLPEIPKGCRVVILDLDMLFPGGVAPLFFLDPAKATPWEKAPGAASLYDFSPYGKASGTLGNPAGTYYQQNFEWITKLRNSPQEQARCQQVLERSGRAASHKHDCMMSNAEAKAWYSVGPPQIMHQEDLALLVPLWYNETIMMIRTSSNPWAIDMISWMVVCAQLGLRHGIGTSLMVSNPHQSCLVEGWSSISPRLAERSECSWKKGDPLPVIHYAQFYTTNILPDSDPRRKTAGQFFGKYEFSQRHGGKFWDPPFDQCDGPLPQIDLSTKRLTRLAASGGEPGDSSSSDLRPNGAALQRRISWMLLNVVQAHNDAFVHYRLMCAHAGHGQRALAQQPAVAKPAVAKPQPAPKPLPLLPEPLLPAQPTLVQRKARDFPPRKSPFGRKLKVAYAITVTSMKVAPFVDGAAVLAHSIRSVNSQHEISFLCIVPRELHLSDQLHAALAEAGYRVLPADVPISRAEIKGDYLRETFEDAGCCGSLELLKLHAYTLEDYDRVLMLDGDSLLLRNLDHVFEASVLERRSLVFTWDATLEAHASRLPPVQGGFLLVAPNRSVHAALVAVLRKGDFREGSGWGGTRVGWAWGGRTVQGLLAYYYGVLAPPSDSLALDPCEYNAMADAKPAGASHPSTDCGAVTLGEVHSAHFTFCQKPWSCNSHASPLCEQLTAQWWRLRGALERSHKRTPAPACSPGGPPYQPLYSPLKS